MGHVADAILQQSVFLSPLEISIRCESQIWEVEKVLFNQEAREQRAPLGVEGVLWKNSKQEYFILERSAVVEEAIFIEQIAPSCRWYGWFWFYNDAI